VKVDIMAPKLEHFFSQKSGKSKLTKSPAKLDYKNFFGLAFVLGTISITLGWKLDSLYLCGVVLPILCMLAYSSLGFIEKKNDTLIEQFADSIYYLGFLLTLVALIVSLVDLSEAEYSLNGVGSRFGIALATTVLGLFLRIILTNFRESFSDKKVILEEQLAKSMKDFSYQVQIQARTLRTTTDLYNTSIELSISSMNKSIEQVAKTFERTNEQLSLAVTNVVKKIELIQISEDILTSPIQKPIKKLADLLDEYKDGFASLTQEQKKISRDNELFSNNLTKLNESSTKLGSSIQNISDGISNVHLEIDKKHQNNMEEFMQTSKVNLNLLNGSFIKSVQFVNDELGQGSNGGSQ